MKKGSEICPNDFTGVYQDIAEVIGVEATLLLHKNFQGQQITLPKKLYTKGYILRQIEKEGNSVSIKSIASKYGYTERRMRQIMKESEC